MPIMSERSVPALEAVPHRLDDMEARILNVRDSL
jgi:hypothetical protein